MKGFLFMKIRISAGTVRGILLTAAVLICMGCSSVKTWAQQEQLSGKMEDVKTSEDIQEPGNAKGPEDAQAYSTKSAQEGWICRNQKYLYYEGGRKVKGIKTINGKKYYFDSKGVQHTGWQKYEDQYYFFKTANAGKGFMTVSDKINDITLASDGKAKLTEESRAKLEILAMANQIVEKASKPAMTKQEKLRKSFDYLLEHYQYRGSPEFLHTRHWEQDYARAMFWEKHGSCYAYGAAFAFLANAAGYKNCYAVSSGGHGWAEAGGKVYDPSWQLIDKNHSYFGVSFSLSGVEGRPNYRRARRFVVKI